MLAILFQRGTNKKTCALLSANQSRTRWMVQGSKERNPRGASPVPPPEGLPGFPGASRSKPKTPRGKGSKGRRPRWKDPDGTIYEWDSLHGTVERFNARGQHIGEFDHETGEQLKDANPNYEVEP